MDLVRGESAAGIGASQTLVHTHHALRESDHPKFRPEYPKPPKLLSTPDPARAFFCIAKLDQASHGLEESGCDVFGLDVRS